MLQFLKNLYRKVLPKKYHFYRVRFIYRREMCSRDIFIIRNAQLGLSKQKDILKNREMKKLVTPLHKLQGVENHTLCNGVLVFQPLEYLGYFAPDKEDVEEY